MRSPDGSPLGSWESVCTQPVYGCGIFSVHRCRRRSLRTGTLHDFHVLEMPDWVNVIPLTAKADVVMVRQYRHGIADLTLEIPGGMVDAADRTPLDAARREMLEETGYDSDDIVALGVIHPNPALQNNRCHTYLARRALQRTAPAPAGTEHTEPVLVPLAEIPELIRTGGITHALVVVAFQWLLFAEGVTRERPARG